MGTLEKRRIEEKKSGKKSGSREKISAVEREKCGPGKREKL